MPLLALLLALLLLAPATAAADDAFLAVLTDGRVARTTEQTRPGLTAPARPAGLVPGDRLVAVARRSGPVWAVGRLGRLYRLDPRTARATPVGGAFALPGPEVTIALDAAEMTARLVAADGTVFLLDLAAATTTAAPRFRDEAGRDVRPALTALPDGRAIGFDRDRSNLVRETAPGSGVLTGQPVRDLGDRPVPDVPPIALALGSDARPFLVTSLDFGSRFGVRQSQLAPIVTRPDGSVQLDGRDGFLRRRVASIAALDPVAADRRAPRVRVTWPRVLRASRLERDVRRLRVRCDEACGMDVRLVAGGQRVSLAGAFRDTPGVLRLGETGRVYAGERALLRRAGRARLQVRVSDYARNARVLRRTVRIVP